MNKLYEEFFNIIEKHDSICIFGHRFPDGDCYGSSEGLKAMINYLYPEKKVYVLGTDIPKIPSYFPRMDNVSDEVISSSLVITVDLPDKPRVSDARAFSLPNKGFIKVDHHILKDHFGDLEIVEDEASSCCEILAKIFYTKVDRLPIMVANLLYYGFTTDTNRFLYSTKESALIGAKLIANDANTKDIYKAINTVSEKSIKMLGYMYSHYQKTRLGVTYLIVNYQEGLKLGYDPHSIAVFVNAIGRIQDSKIWVVIAETADHKAFCEFRSLGDIDVQKIAFKFTGGGHLNASGCTLDKFSRAQEVIDECENVLLNEFAPYQKELSCLLDLAEKTSKTIMSYYNKGFDVEMKEDNSPVTSADLASDKIIRTTLKEKFPSYGFLSEEDKDDTSRLNKEFVFVIDPLDGTKDFVNRDNMFATNLALVKNHEPVVAVCSIPYENAIYFAVKDKGSYRYSKDDMISKLHVSFKKDNLTVLNSAFHKNEKYIDLLKEKKEVKEVKYIGSALKSCLIAQGSAEVCYSLGKGTKEWDTCAPQLILQEAGGVFLTNHLKPITYNREEVRNLDGFTALNSLDNKLFSIEELEMILK